MNKSLKIKLYICVYLIYKYMKNITSNKRNHTTFSNKKNLGGIRMQTKA